MLVACLEADETLVPDDIKACLEPGKNIQPFAKKRNGSRSITPEQPK
jgi:hypothetical protein